ncbi:hypothetical protein LguiA_003371 [Lonicera macranthoides]
MRGGTVQINWHDTKPVLALDFHPFSGILATAGADFDIKLWLINSGEVEKKVPTVNYQNSLTYHGSAVNALRFSPSGEQLASGADGGEMIIWKLHTTEEGQAWKVLKTLSFHRKDVLDVQWSSDGAFLISGSVDNSCIIWDVNKGSVHQILDAHFHYVQGVAWDPLAKYAASLSSDRTCRIYVNKPQKTKGIEKINYEIQSAKTHLFHDETLPSFFRRLAWSPDGSFLLLPAVPAQGRLCPSLVLGGGLPLTLARPALLLPGASKPVVAVRFCPMAFSLRGSSSSAFFKLPYRLIFAVATLNSLYIYDTQSIQPIAILAGLHYAAVTDISWSPTGKYVALSSQDGYCTLVEFENDELGPPVSFSENKVMGDENKISIQNLEDTKRNEDTTNKNDIVDVESLKADAEINEVKQMPPSLITSTPAPNKPAKRRITPMAID